MGLCASVGEAVDDVVVFMVEVLVVVEVLVLDGAVEDVVLDEDLEVDVELVEVPVEVLVLDDVDVEVLVDVVEGRVLVVELVVEVDDTARDETAATL